MAQRRNQSYMIPAPLLDQITTRAAATSRSRNEEMRQLLAAGLEMAADGEIVAELPEGEKIRSVVWIEHEMAQDVKSRARKFHRSAGAEVVVLVAYALQKIIDRDLALIREMMTRGDQPAPAH